MENQGVKIFATKNAKSLLAKLMAEENITIQHKQVDTASFDMVRRILTVPIWKDMGADLYDLFMGHEVGHALWTPSDIDVLEEAVSRSNKDFINVVEDARIEKNAKKKFPGLKGPFFRAYRELLAKDFFGIGNKNLADMAFIDRLNIYFKAAMTDYESVDIFSDEEMVFVDRMSNTNTFAEVADLSEDIYNYLGSPKNQDQQENEGESDLSEMKGMSQEFNDDSGDFDESEDQSDDQSNDTDGSGQQQSDKNSESDSQTNDASGEDGEDDTDTEIAQSGDNGEEELLEGGNNITDGKKGGNGSNADEFVSTTDTSATESMMDYIDREAGDINYLTLPNINVEDFVIDYKEAHASIELVKENYLDTYSSYIHGENDNTKLLKKTLQENNKTIQYLVKEFEMKKAAEAYSNQTVAKSGNINTSKLWSYKLNDDIFQRKSILPDGKNHGLVMMVDWSGSMYAQLYKTVVQVITLATFARRVGIPFEVYNFTDQLTHEERNSKEFSDTIVQEGRKESNIDRILSPYGTKLRQMLSNKMKNREFIDACNNYLFIAWAVTNAPYSINVARENQLGGTPLVASLQIMEKVVHKFQKENQVEKLSFIVLSDGDAADGIDYCMEQLSWCSSKGMRIPMALKKTINENVEQSWVITDERSGKKIVWNAKGWNRGKTSTEIMLELIKTLHNAKSVGFYIVNNNRDLKDAIRSYCMRNRMGWVPNADYTAFKKTCREDGFLTASDCGYDEYYIVDQRSQTQGNDDEMDIDDTMTRAKIARNFSKFQSSKKTSRLMLNKFVDLVK